MKIKEQPITQNNLFEQMAIITKNKLIKQGVLPSDANKLAIEFVKENGEKIIINVLKK
jgi:hypothetical protein